MRRALALRLSVVISPGILTGHFALATDGRVRPDANVTLKSPNFSFEHPRTCMMSARCCSTGAALYASCQCVSLSRGVRWMQDSSALDVRI
jgi:hypothetical protein